MKRDTLGHVPTYSWVSSMGAKRDQANVTTTLVARLVICANNAEARVLASSSRVGLERCRVESCNFAKIVFQFLCE